MPNIRQIPTLMIQESADEIFQTLSTFQVFGIFNTIAYAAGAYFLYIEWKSTNTP